jgi:hypothetical protein
MDKRDAVDDSWEAIERRTALLLSELERLDGPSALAAPTPPPEARGLPLRAR